MQELVAKSTSGGANGITQATPTYFFIAFVIALGEIFLEYSCKSL
jgi:hypothetical protein